MNPASLYLILLTPSVLLAQNDPEKYVNPYRPALPEAPAEVAAAKAVSQTVQRDGATGGTVTLQVIEPPVFAAPETRAVAPTALKSEEERAALGAAMPSEFKLFAPSVVLFPNGVSLVHWSHPDWTRFPRQLDAWVQLDLESIESVGDLTVGKCCYVMMPAVFPANPRLQEQYSVPELEAFRAANGIIMLEGDAMDAPAMEPLHALLVEYSEKGGLIVSSHEQRKAMQKEQAEWEAANPTPPQSLTVKFWTVQSAEYPVALRK